MPKDGEGDARGEPEEWEEGCKGVLREWEEGGAQQGGEDQHQLHHLDDGEKEVCHVVDLTDLRLGILYKKPVLNNNKKHIVAPHMV